MVGQAEIEGLIERTKNWGITKKPDGSTIINMKLSFTGSVLNYLNSEEKDEWGLREVIRIYNLGREAWLNGDLETVADMFGILV